MLEEALVRHREAGNASSTGITPGHLAGLKARRGADRVAEDGFRAASEIDRRVGNRLCEGIHACELAAALERWGRPSEAVGCWRAGVAILAGMPDVTEWVRLK